MRAWWEQLAAAHETQLPVMARAPQPSARRFTFTYDAEGIWAATAARKREGWYRASRTALRPCSTHRPQAASGGTGRGARRRHASPRIRAPGPRPNPHPHWRRWRLATSGRSVVQAWARRMVEPRPGRDFRALRHAPRLATRRANGHFAAQSIAHATRTRPAKAPRQHRALTTSATISSRMVDGR